MEVITHYFWLNAEYLLRMIVAGICGAVIGFERSRRRKEAGLRTHIIVALGAALLMIVSKYGFWDVLDTPGMRVDASRIAANVITGISFLGAGTIFVRKVSIRGLTTAAGIWSMAGIGLAIGAGLYLVGISATLLILFIQICTHGHLRGGDSMVHDTLSLTYSDIPNGLDQLKELLEKYNIRIHHIQMEKREDGTVQVTLDVSRGHEITCTELADIFAKDERIKEFRL